MSTKSFEELRNDHEFQDYIPYGALLQTIEWQNKRNEIIKRDKFVCTKCNHSPTIQIYDQSLRKNSYFSYGESKITTVQIEGGGKFEVSLPEQIAEEKHYHLNIHHKYYIKGRCPWSYPSEALITLCNWCHHELHKTEIINIFDYAGDLIHEMTRCRRCDGEGWLPEYKHVESGVCFHCQGAKFEELIKIKVADLSL